MEAERSDGLSLMLFSGTDDKLSAATILISGAAAMGRKVNVLLQYWALEAFHADRIAKDHGVSAEAGPEGAQFLALSAEQPGHQHWSETLRQVKQLGEVRINACAHSLEMFGFQTPDLDPLVDGVEGIASFLADATGSVVFI